MVGAGEGCRGGADCFDEADGEKCGMDCLGVVIVVDELLYIGELLLYELDDLDEFPPYLP
jgi:hypothetical protein